MGIVPPNGYRRRDNQSKVALQWLKSISPHLRTAMSPEGEFQVGPYKLDGYDCEGKVVYEFHGCSYHGCPKCFDSNMVHPLHKPQRMGEIYQRTLDRMNFLKSALPDHDFEEMWECEFKKSHSVEPLDIQDPIGSRDALYGGRVDCTRLYAEGNLKFVDINSLYPHSMKYNTFPRSNPRVILSGFNKQCDAYFGVMKVKILAPQNLFHPVLPFRHDSKLFFPLCRTCCITRSEACSHNVEERALLGTWCTPEVYEAMRSGYEILEIYEVWQYDETFQPKELFGGYVDMFLGMKICASGFPPGIVTTQEKQAHVDEFYQREGIRINVEDITKSVSLRSTAKLILNNLWGRLGMSSDKTAVEFIDTYEEFLKIMTDQSREVHDMRLINDDVAMICHSPQESFVQPNVNGSPVIASFVTCFARLKLLEMLKKLGSRVCYFDTDSIIYLSHPGQYDPPCGPHLGDWEEEYPGEQITNFIGLGPKNYCLKFQSGKLVVKAKGISLTSRTMEKITYETMHDLLGHHEKEVRIDIPHHIRRDKATGVIRHADTSKTYRFSYEKRIFNGKNGFVTLPYGYNAPYSDTTTT